MNLEAESAGKLLPEVALDTAPPRVRLIYREIQDLSGARMPALIFRRLAVRPPALEWVWQSLNPVLRDGWLQDQARLLMEQLKFPPTPQLLAIASGVDVGEQDLATVQKILKTYNRVNPINLLVVKTALLLLGPVSSNCFDHRRLLLPPELAPIPDPLSLEEIEPTCRQIVLELSSFVPASSDGILVPTLYRHLARWPELFSQLAAPIKQRLVDGTLQSCADHFSSTADTVASKLCTTNSGLEVGMDLKVFVKMACEPFLTSIPQLSVIGKMLETEIFRNHARVAA
ncbi:hypothetical protein BH11PSE7_BH11PSE7_32260 [soil metagenome]